MEHTYHQLHKDTDIEKELLEKQIKEIEKRWNGLKKNSSIMKFKRIYLTSILIKVKKSKTNFIKN